MLEKESQPGPIPKRKRSQSSPDLGAAKALKMGKDDKKLVEASPESKGALKEIQARFGSLEQSMDQVAKATSVVMNQHKEVMMKLDAIDKDNKSLIERNAKDIRDTRDNLARYATDTDKRLKGIEDKVSDLTSLLESGQGSLALSSGKYNHETEHEKNLAALIEEAKSIVTILGCKEPEVTSAKIAHLLTEAGYTIPSPATRTILGVTKLGNPASESPPLKVQLDSPASADMLLNQARTLARAHRDSGKEGPLTLRVVKHYPQPYSMAAKDFRQMSSYIYDNGGLAQMEYEGTTLTLRGKSKEVGGQWVVVKGCSFKPAAVGREAPCDGETPEMSIARDLLDKLVDNHGTSNAARSLYYRTEEELSTLKDMSAHLGPVLSEDLTKVIPSKCPSRGKYTLLYETRKAAVVALHKSNSKDLISGFDRDHESLALKVAVVAHGP